MRSGWPLSVTAWSQTFTPALKSTCSKQNTFQIVEHIVGPGQRCARWSEPVHTTSSPVPCPVFQPGCFADRLACGRVQHPFLPTTACAVNLIGVQRSVEAWPRQSTASRLRLARADMWLCILLYVGTLWRKPVSTQTVGVARLHWGCGWSGCADLWQACFHPTATPSPGVGGACRCEPAVSDV